MSKSHTKPKEKDTNITHFLQTKEYEALRAGLQSEINNNSEMFNIELPNGRNLKKGSNLLKPVHETFTKTKEEKLELKKVKKEYEPNDDARNAIIAQFGKASIPNWDVKFKPLKRKAA